jgi:hypothetical protein
MKRFFVLGALFTFFISFAGADIPLQDLHGNERVLRSSDVLSMYYFRYIPDNVNYGGKGVIFREWGAGGDDETEIFVAPRGGVSGAGFDCLRGRSGGETGRGSGAAGAHQPRRDAPDHKGGGKVSPSEEWCKLMERTSFDIGRY